MKVEYDVPLPLVRRRLDGATEAYRNFLKMDKHVMALHFESENLAKSAATNIGAYNKRTGINFVVVARRGSSVFVMKKEGSDG